MHKHALRSVRPRFFANLISQGAQRTKPQRADNDLEFNTALQTPNIARTEAVNALCVHHEEPAEGRRVSPTFHFPPRLDRTTLSSTSQLTLEDLAFRHVESLLDDDTLPLDPGQISHTDTDTTFEYESYGATSVANPDEPDTRPLPGLRSLPRVHTANQLFKNLLSILYLHRPSPPPVHSIVRYYLSMDHSLHSIKAYNLLIELTLRHTAFDLTPRLVHAMKRGKIRTNVETVKLLVRWQVLVGRWDAAWRGLQWHLQAAKDVVKPRGHPTGASLPIPLPVWLEFLGASKRGWVRQSVCNSLQHEGASTSKTPSEDTRKIFIRRCTLLFQNLPLRETDRLLSLPPRALYLTVQMMLTMQLRDIALDLTRAFIVKNTTLIAGTPTSLSEKYVLSLVHLHLAHFPLRVASVRPMYRTIKELLALHPASRPNAATAHLLLRPMHRAIRSGTIAEAWIRKLKREWGPHIENSRVRRRVASYALKERKMGLLASALGRELDARHVRRAWGTVRIVKGGANGKPRRRFVRMAHGSVWRGRGTENRLWFEMRRRIERRLSVLGKELPPAPTPPVHRAELGAARKWRQRQSSS